MAGTTAVVHQLLCDLCPTVLLLLVSRHGGGELLGCCCCLAAADLLLRYGCPIDTHYAPVVHAPAIPIKITTIIDIHVAMLGRAVARRKPDTTKAKRSLSGGDNASLHSVGDGQDICLNPCSGSYSARTTRMQ